MSATILGAASTLKGGKSTANVTFTGVAFGTDNLTLGAAGTATVVPGGRGVIAAQRSPFVTYDFSFVTDANATTDPVLRNLNGKRSRWEFSDTENTYTFQAIATVSLGFDYATDRQVYTVALAIDGVPAVT